MIDLKKEKVMAIDNGKGKNEKGGRKSVWFGVRGMQSTSAIA